jgi:hypothetical protein
LGECHLVDEFAAQCRHAEAIPSHQFVEGGKVLQTRLASSLGAPHQRRVRVRDLGGVDGHLVVLTHLVTSLR